MLIKGGDILDSKKKALLFAHLAMEKKAKDVVILDMRKLLGITDYFIICSGENDRQIKAIVEKVDQDFSKVGESILHKEGLYESGWIVLDFGDIIGHVFTPKTREFYALESLWADAPCVRQDEDTNLFFKDS